MKKICRIAILMLMVIFVSSASCFAVKTPDLLIDVYAAERGWMEAAVQGEDAGTTGESRQLEAIRIRTFNGSEIAYRVELAGIGWQPWVGDGEVSGLPGGGKAIVAIQIKCDDGDRVVAYRTHIAEIGWVGYVYGPEISGVHTNRIEAITVKFPVEPVDSSRGKANILDLFQK